LKYFGGDDVFGDVVGPYANQTIFGRAKSGEDLSRALRALNIRYLLISKRHSPAEWQRLPSAPFFGHIYTDDGADLWRVR
jgi:hypothetical protein